MIDFAKREIIVCKRLAENEAKVFLEGAVIDVDRTWCISKPAIIFGTLQMKEECTQMWNIRIIQRNAVCILQPGAAFEDRLLVAVDRTRAVIDQFQNIGNALELRFIKS